MSDIKMKQSLIASLFNILPCKNFPAAASF
jgi:hypothetical protein